MRSALHRLQGLASFAVATAFAVVALHATSVLAQDREGAEPAGSGEEVKGNTRVVEIDAVERGFSVSIDYGPNYFFFIDQPGFVKLNQDYVTPGTRMGLRLGYDLLNNISVDAFALANFNKGVLDADALAKGDLTGDLAHFAFGAGLRFAFVTTDRVFAYVRVGAGYALWFPPALAENATGSIHTDASIGVEYYTKLRHLSIGLELDVQALLLPYAFGLQLYPTIKYTF